MSQVIIIMLWMSQNHNQIFIHLHQVTGCKKKSSGSVQHIQMLKFRTKQNKKILYHHHFTYTQDTHENTNHWTSSKDWRTDEMKWETIQTHTTLVYVYIYNFFIICTKKLHDYMFLEITLNETLTCKPQDECTLACFAQAWPDFLIYRIFCLRILWCLRLPQLPPERKSRFNRSAFTRHKRPHLFCRAASLEPGTWRKPRRMNNQRTGDS